MYYRNYSQTYYYWFHNAVYLSFSYYISTTAITVTFALNFSDSLLSSIDIFDLASINTSRSMNYSSSFITAVTVINSVTLYYSCYYFHCNSAKLHSLSSDHPGADKNCEIFYFEGIS